MVLNKKLEKPFTKVPPDGNNLSMLQATEVKAKLTQRVKNIMNKRDKSEERRLKIMHGNVMQSHRTTQLNPSADQASQDIIQEINLRQSQKSRQLSGSQKRQRTPTACFANEDLNLHNVGLKNMKNNVVSQKSLYNQNYRSSMKGETQPISKNGHVQFEDQATSEDPNFMVNLLPSDNNGSFINQITQSPIRGEIGMDKDIGLTNFYQPIHEDASANAKAKIKDLQGQLVKVKADKNVLDITVKHLQTELNSKSQLARRQADELATLRESVLELQR